MIELQHDNLAVSFPELKEQPGLTITFQRTLRIPDDSTEYPLPPGLGPFPLRHIDDYAATLPPGWLNRGGVLLPMWQSEAMWLSFQSDYIEERATEYPFAIRVAAGKINAVTGDPWQRGLSRNPQNYLVVPTQPWLDGFCVRKGLIRQFVAMPLGQGYSVEEQITGAAEFGGLQIEIFPMRREIFDKRFPVRRLRQDFRELPVLMESCPEYSLAPMGLAPGGQMRQEIYEDPFNIHDWDTSLASRCFIHLVNSATWHQITGQAPPSQPPTAKQYTASGLPWFDYYDADQKALPGSTTLAGLKSVKEKSGEKRAVPLLGNEPISIPKIVKLRAGLKPNQVREADFA